MSSSGEAAAAAAASTFFNFDFDYDTTATKLPVIWSKRVGKEIKQLQTKPPPGVAVDDDLTSFSPEGGTAVVVLRCVVGDSPEPLVLAVDISFAKRCEFMCSPLSVKSNTCIYKPTRPLPHHFS